MKNIFFLLLTFSMVSSSAQTAFESEADVLLYLNTKSPFTNKSVNISLTFSDMASRLSTGSASYYSPDITILSSSRAVVKYQSLSNPDVVASFIVDTKTNTLTDRKDKTEFIAFSFEVENKKETPIKPTTTNPNNTESKKPPTQTQSSKNSANVKRDPNPKKDFANVFYNPEYTLFDLYTDEPIFPDSTGVYQIYTATNENKTPKLLKGTAQEISEATVYKFKNYKNCKDWCDGRKQPTQN